jgi:hypothetical protein
MTYLSDRHVWAGRNPAAVVATSSVPGWNERLGASAPPRQYPGTPTHTFSRLHRQHQLDERTCVISTIIFFSATRTAWFLDNACTVSSVFWPATSIPPLPVVTRGTLSGSWHCDPDCDLQRCGQLKARQLQARMLCCAWPHHHDGSCCVISVDAMLGVFIYVFMLAISVGIVSVFSTHLVQHREFLHLAVSIR